MNTASAIQSHQIADSNEYSTLPLALVLSTVILSCAAGGWFLLNLNTPASGDAAVEAVDPLPGPAGSVATGTGPIDVDLELRKARLAASADILALPEERSALYFYGRVMDAAPDHTVAGAELDAVLARISTIVTAHLAAGEFESAYTLAALVAEQKPGHPLVDDTRMTLNEHAARLVAEANQHAQDGNDAEAAAALDLAGRVPGLNAVYIAAVRESISEIQQARIDAELSRVEQERLATEQEIADWTGLVRGAIDAGALLTPAGESALDYLTAREAPADVKTQLTEELIAALTTEIQLNLESGDLAIAESLLGAAGDLGNDAEDLVVLRGAVESKLIEAEGSKVLGLSDFVHIKTEPAIYPRRANRLNVTGWVDLEFTVTSTGVTADIKVLESEPHNMFEKSALQAVEQWQFVPRQYRGQLIDQRAAARLVFQLE